MSPVESPTNPHHQRRIFQQIFNLFRGFPETHYVEEKLIDTIGMYTIIFLEIDVRKLQNEGNRNIIIKLVEENYGMGLSEGKFHFIPYVQKDEVMGSIRMTRNVIFNYTDSLLEKDMLVTIFMANVIYMKISKVSIPHGEMEEISIAICELQTILVEKKMFSSAFILNFVDLVGKASITMGYPQDSDEKS